MDELKDTVHIVASETILELSGSLCAMTAVMVHGEPLQPNLVVERGPSSSMGDQTRGLFAQIAVRASDIVRGSRSPLPGPPHLASAEEASHHPFTRRSPGPQEEPVVHELSVFQWEQRSS